MVPFLCSATLSSVARGATDIPVVSGGTCLRLAVRAIKYIGLLLSNGIYSQEICPVMHWIQWFTDFTTRIQIIPCYRWYEQKVLSEHKGSILSMEKSAQACLGLENRHCGQYASLRIFYCIFMQPHQKDVCSASTGKCNHLEWPSWIFYLKTTKGPFFSRCNLCLSLKYLYGKKVSQIHTSDVGDNI